MHTNHRRKNLYRAKHHDCPWPLVYSMKAERRTIWRKRRAQLRDLMHHERFDVLPARYPHTVLWDYW